MAQGDAAVARALAQVVDDHGWLVAAEHARLRAALVDVLGGQADEHRGSLDAIVVSAEEGVATDVRRAGRPLADDQRAALTARLEEWGLDAARAAWVVETWEALAPQVTAPAPEPRHAPEPPPAPEPRPPVAAPAGRATSPQPGTVPEAAVTQLPPPAAGPPPAAAGTAPDDVAPGGPVRPTRGRRTAALAGAAVVLLVGAGIGAYALTRGDDEPAAATGDGSTTTTGATTAGDGGDAAPPADEGALAVGADVPADAVAGTSPMVSRTGGVRIAQVGRVEEADFGDGPRSAPEGGSLLVFRLADAPCEGDTCTPWKRLGLRVLVSSAAERLPAGSDTFVLAVPAGDDPELEMKVDGYRQTLSLADGTPGPENIAVLARRDRVTRIGAQFSVPESTSGVFPSGTPYTDRAERQVRVTSADLQFFAAGTHPADPGKAFLKVRADYSVAGAGGGYAFEPGEISFVSDQGRRYEARDLDPGDSTNAVFVVPATLTGGTFVVGGTRTTTAVDGSTIRVVVGEHELRVRLD